jgi:hypothetical protein
LAEAKKVAADRVRDLKELEVAAEAVSLRARFQLAEARGDPHFGRAAEPGKAWAPSKHHELGLKHAPCSISTKSSASRNPFGIGLRKRHARRVPGATSLMFRPTERSSALRKLILSVQV